MKATRKLTRADIQRKAHFKGLRKNATPAIQLNNRMFEKKILEFEKYHKEEAMEWSEQQNWDSLYDEFARYSDMYKYFYFKTVEEFAEIVSKGNEDKKRWMMKSIGPVPKKEIKWQGDWAMQRTIAYSKDLEHTRLLEKKLESDFNMFQISLPLAGTYESWRDTVNELREKISDFFNQNLQERPKKFKDEKEKSKWEKDYLAEMNHYLGWMERLFDFKSKIDHRYLVALGLDKPNMIQFMSGFLQRQLPKNGEAPQNGTQQNAFDMFMAVSRMEIEKSRAFDVPLPDDYQKVIDTTAREIPTNGNGNHSKKKEKVKTS